MELFNTEKKDQLPPLPARFIPKNLDEILGQDHILGKGKLLRRAIESDRLFSVIFYGPPGCGKTALAKVIANMTQACFIEENATSIGVADIRRLIMEAYQRRRIKNQKTIILLDEIHHFNRTQQDALLPDVEKGNIILIGTTTENPFFYINKALISRSQIFEFKSLDESALKTLLFKALKDKENGLGEYNVEITDDAVSHLIKHSEGDGRKLLQALEVGVLTTPPTKNNKIIYNLKVAEESIQKKAIVYDRASDYHYDHISAFIKSMRGSDPDATLYWLVKMLSAGEDPRYIARRIIILASEDIGNADPQALVIASAALNAVEFVGMPEAEFALAQAAIYMACAPKSNSVLEALERTKKELSKERTQEVPTHLKDSHMDAKAFKHGEGYLYPHNYPSGIVKQDYMQKKKIFYIPKDIGYEKEIKKRLNALKKIVK